ncbi:MAG: YchJ family protein [Melioribacteraceae bacterium]|nr:YchJ family protein [Melioribacteraceae bacterium]
MEMCPCSSGQNYAECCEPIIKGEKQAGTAEALMRSRYTAYTKHEVEYIGETIHPDQRTDYDEKATKEWSHGSEWLGLEIINTEAGTEADEEGTVEFKAKFKQQGYDLDHHELSEFKKADGKWYFFNGEAVANKPVVREEPKIGRNDPCTCGSGKKYKKCCG